MSRPESPEVVPESALSGVTAFPVYASAVGVVTERVPGEIYAEPIPGLFAGEEYQEIEANKWTMRTMLSRDVCNLWVRGDVLSRLYKDKKSGGVRRMVAVSDQLSPSVAEMKQILDPGIPEGQAPTWGEWLTRPLWARRNAVALSVGSLVTGTSVIFDMAPGIAAGDVEGVLAGAATIGVGVAIGAFVDNRRRMGRLKRYANRYEGAVAPEHLAKNEVSSYVMHFDPDVVIRSSSTPAIGFTKRLKAERDYVEKDASGRPVGVAIHLDGWLNAVLDGNVEQMNDAEFMHRWQTALGPCVQAVAPLVAELEAKTRTLEDLSSSSKLGRSILDKEIAKLNDDIANIILRYEYNQLQISLESQSAELAHDAKERLEKVRALSVADGVGANTYTRGVAAAAEAMMRGVWRNGAFDKSETGLRANGVREIADLAEEAIELLELLQEFSGADRNASLESWDIIREFHDSLLVAIEEGYSAEDTAWMLRRIKDFHKFYDSYFVGPGVSFSPDTSRTPQAEPPLSWETYPAK